MELNADPTPGVAPSEDLATVPKAAVDTAVVELHPLATVVGWKVRPLKDPNLAAACSYKQSAPGLPGVLPLPAPKLPVAEGLA